MKDKQSSAENLTLLKGCEEHLKSAVPTALIGPHADDPKTRAEHDVIGHRATELRLQVPHGAAAVVHSHKVPFALV